MDQPPLADRPPFRMLPLVVAVLLALLGISLGNQWYARNQSLPRYCDDQAQTLEQVRRLLTEQKPAGDGFEARRSYIVSSKLLFLIPQAGDEPLDAYLQRLRGHLERQCR